MNLWAAIKKWWRLTFRVRRYPFYRAATVDGKDVWYVQDAKRAPETGPYASVDDAIERRPIQAEPTAFQSAATGMGGVIAAYFQANYDRIKTVEAKAVDWSKYTPITDADELHELATYDWKQNQNANINRALSARYNRNALEDKQIREQSMQGYSVNKRRKGPRMANITNPFSKEGQEKAARETAEVMRLMAYTNIWKDK